MTTNGLVDKLLACYTDLTVSLAEDDVLDHKVSRWQHVSQEVFKASAAGQLSRAAAATAYTIANNAGTLIASVIALQQRREKELKAFENEIHFRYKVSTSGVQRRSSSGTNEVDDPIPKSTLLPLRREKTGTKASRELVGIVRDWFLTHLPYPYPTYTEKRNLAIQAGIPLSKIDSDLTNWRRRSGWAEIRNIYAKRSKEKMKSLLLRVQRGEDTRPDLLDRIEGIRRYMDKESDKVGDWVHELASFARPEKRPKLDHASPTNTNTTHAGHRSISSVSSSSSLSDISAFATVDDQPSHPHTHDSPSTRSVSASSTLSDASLVIPSQGPKRSMSFADDEQVTNKPKTSHTPLQAKPTWVDSPTEYASSDPSSLSATLVSLGSACDSDSSFTSSSDSSLPSTDGDDGGQTGYDPATGSATAISDALTVTDTVMSSECSSIWSTERELPSLPHMHERSAGSWRIPTLSEFRPEIGRWVQRG